jgi:hypothetical protein
MFRNIRLFEFIGIITLFLAGLTSAQALQPAGPNRPAGVPADYVITPAGYFHPSCVVHLAKGDVLHKDEKTIQHANARVDSVPVCHYAHFKRNGERVVGDERGVRGVRPPTISHAWIEYASTTTSSSYGELGADWNVPSAPSASDGQTIYLFPGLEDYADVVTILQPVLGWNSDYANAWGIASWNCCVSGTVFEATPTRVNVGDKIAGYMWDNCAAGTLSCSSWDVLTEDLTTGNYSELVGTSSQGQTFNWAFAGALEVYNVSRCSDYPAGGSLAFYDLELYDDNFSLYSNPGWSFTNASSGLTPQCGYGATLSPATVTLYY